jgi:hypothetical protein
MHDDRGLFVVYDTKGAGRVVGVFDSSELAGRVQAIDPSYFRVHRSEVNHVRHEALEWLNSLDQRRALRDLIRSEDLDED